MKFDGPVIFSTPTEAQVATKKAGENHRRDLRAFADTLEAEESSIAQRVELATTWLHEKRPDVRFGVVSEFNEERWVVFIFLPEEDRTQFLEEFDEILHRYEGNGLVFEVQERGEYDQEIFAAEPVNL